MSVATEEKLTQESLPTPEAVEAGVLDVLDRALDPDSELHQLFYSEPGESGVAPTQLVEAESLYDDQTLLLKDETEHTVRLDDKLEVVSAFKWRGALMAVSNRVLKGAGGFTAASSGNHAQSIAAAATKYGRSAELFVPSSINPVKEGNIVRLGGTVNKGAPDLEAAKNAAVEAAGDDELAFVHPFDHYDVMAGQATIGVEMLLDLMEQARAGRIDLHEDPIVISLPVGGGGLIAGVAVVFKRARDMGLIGDNVRVVGMQAENKANNLLCDGTATETGDKAQAILHDSRYVQAVHTVDMPALGRSMAHLERVTGKRYEPAGALGACAQEFYPTGYTIVAPMTGASVTAERFEQFLSMPGVDDPETEAARQLDDYLASLPRAVGVVATTSVHRGR